MYDLFVPARRATSSWVNPQRFRASCKIQPSLNSSYSESNALRSSVPGFPHLRVKNDSRLSSWLASGNFELPFDFLGSDDCMAWGFLRVSSAASISSINQRFRAFSLVSVGCWLADPPVLRWCDAAASGFLRLVQSKNFPFASGGVLANTMGDGIVSSIRIEIKIVFQKILNATDVVVLCKCSVI